MEVEFLAVSAEEAVNVHRLFGFWGLSVESALGTYFHRLDARIGADRKLMRERVRECVAYRVGG